MTPLSYKEPLTLQHTSKRQICQRNNNWGDDKRNTNANLRSSVCFVMIVTSGNYKNNSHEKTKNNYCSNNKHHIQFSFHFDIKYRISSSILIVLFNQLLYIVGQFTNTLCNNRKASAVAIIADNRDIRK